VSYSYKTFTNTSDFMKKFVNASEGEVIYGIGHSTFMRLAEEADAIYKVGNSALVNMAVFEKYLEKFREAAVPYKKKECNLKKDKLPESGKEN